MGLLDKIKDAAEEFADDMTDEIGHKTGVDNAEFGELLGDLGDTVKHVSAELSKEAERSKEDQSAATK